MFKKPFKVSQSNAISGKDFKKLKQNLQKLSYSEGLVAALPDTIEFQKVQGSKVCLLATENPLYFSSDSLNLKQDTNFVLPSLYCLYQSYPEKSGLIAVYVKQGVENFIFNGADLMWPGVLSVEGPSMFKQNQGVVVYADNAMVQRQIERVKTSQATGEDI